MEVRSGYKLTEVGVIPEDWGIAELGTLAMIERGKFSARPRNDPQYYDGKYPFLQTGDVTRSGGRISSFTQTLNDRGLSVSRLFPSGTLFFTIAANIGDVGIANFEAACPDSLVAISPRGETEKEWLLYELAARKENFEALASPGAQLNINLEKLRPFLLPIPPLLDQRAIATTFSGMDALLDGLNRLIAKKRAIKQATMQQLLTGQTRLPGFSGEWEVKRLGEVANVLKGSGLSRSTLSTSGKNYCILYGDLFTTYDRVIVSVVGRTDSIEGVPSIAGDILMPSSTTTIGVDLATASALMIEGVLLGGDINIIRRKTKYDIVPEFLANYLTHRKKQNIAEITQGITIHHLYGRDIKTLNVAVPSVAEQMAIAAILSDIDAEITALETRRTKTRALKQAMMQELLTGKTRLVEPDTKPAEQAAEQTEGRKANVHFLRSVLAAEIIDQLHDQPTFGHVKFEKMMFLVEHLCGVDTGSTYYRKAAGPYDNRALRSIDSQLQKQQWFEVQKENGRYRYTPMAKRGGHKQYFERYFPEIGDTFGKILSTFKTLGTERCEIVATLLAAWSDLLREKGSASDETIVHEVLNNWHESKRRISEDRWLKALGWMRDQGFVPKGVT